MLVNISILSMTSCVSSLLFGRVGCFFLRSLYRASAPFLISLGYKWLSSKVCSSFLTTADGRIETSPEFVLDRMCSCLASAFRTVGSYPQTCWFLVLMIATPSESVVIDFVQFFFMLHIYTMSPFLGTFILLYIYPSTIWLYFPYSFPCVLSPWFQEQIWFGMSEQKVNIDQFTNRIQVRQWLPVGPHLYFNLNFR